MSSVTISGISDAFVEPDENNINVISFNESTGSVQIRYTGEKPELHPGHIIAVDLDTMGYLRKVTGMFDDGDILAVETIQAFLSDVFVEREIKLHTGLMNPGIQLKSTTPREKISKALTDKTKFIHSP
jgi:hypothetical protein